MKWSELKPGDAIFYDHILHVLVANVPSGTDCTTSRARLSFSPSGHVSLHHQRSVLSFTTIPEHYEIWVKEDL